MLEFVFWFALCVVVYVYAGYPLLLWAVARKSDEVGLSAIAERPFVTVIVSAFNEEDVIESKILNAISSTYPADKIEVLVVSDCSDDGTDDIVKRYSDRGIRLIRMEERGGKTLGLNRGVSEALGEIIVFSDANAMYKENAIGELVKTFTDATVGAVVGESTYYESSDESAQSESLYWLYEVAIKRWEGFSGSIVGGDGAIYAIRKNLYQNMHEDALSDFVNPLQVVKQGYRCVYEPNAICIEDAANSFAKEYRRKVRIVNRAWRALSNMREMLNVFRYGFFSVKLISHKLLRWLAPFFLLAIAITNIALVASAPIYILTLALQLLFYTVAFIGYLNRGRRSLHWVLKVPYYFCLVNLAAAQGIVEALAGRKYTMWTTVRENSGSEGQS